MQGALTSWQGAAPDAEGGIWPMSQSETVTPKNPPNPPFAKGGPRGILME